MVLEDSSRLQMSFAFAKGTFPESLAVTTVMNAINITANITAQTSIITKADREYMQIIPTINGNSATTMIPYSSKNSLISNASLIDYIFFTLKSKMNRETPIGSVITPAG